MPVQIPQFAKIKDFSVLQRESEQTLPEYYEFKQKDQNNVETTDNDDFVQNPTRSLKANIKCPQVSFERNFMLQHIQAFDFYVQNYIGEMFESHQIEMKNFINEDIFPKKFIFIDTHTQITYYLKSSECILSLKKVQIFMEDLVHQQKLMEFLQYICSKSCDQVALELLMITLQVWEQYLTIQKEHFSYQKLIQYSKNLVEQIWETLKSKKLINFISFDKTALIPDVNFQKKQLEQRKFIESIIVTLILIICEYFNNPYYQEKVQMQHKRHLFFTNNSLNYDYDSFSQSEQSDDSEMFTKSKKKRK